MRTSFDGKPQRSWLGRVSKKKDIEITVDELNRDRTGYLRRGGGQYGRIVVRNNDGSLYMVIGGTLSQTMFADPQRFDNETILKLCAFTIAAGIAIGLVLCAAMTQPRVPFMAPIVCEQSTR